MDNDEKKRIGKELKRFLVTKRIVREDFADQAGISKGSLDKFVIGIFSEKMYSLILERTSFRMHSIYASKMLGAYAKSSWNAYLNSYEMIHPSLSGDGSIIVSNATISWDDMIPGMTLSVDGQHVGVLWIPHERSPLIYIQPVEDIGVRLILSTMVGEPCMRGLLMTVDNVLANAYIPVSLPVSLYMSGNIQTNRQKGTRVILENDQDYEFYRFKILEITERKFGRLIG